jgi:ketosteroid isomerase-like protein
VILAAVTGDNVEIVKRLQPSGIDMVAAAHSAPDVEPFADIPAPAFAEDFTAAFFGSGMRGEYEGVEGLIAGWRDWLVAWESYDLEAEEFIAAGEHVVVFVRARGRTTRDGVEMEHAPAAVWTLRDGLVRRIEFHIDRDEALAAAGLER